MWILFARAPRPDAIVWSGRRLLAAIDAIVWPAIVFWVLLSVPGGFRRDAPGSGRRCGPGSVSAIAACTLVESSLPVHDLAGRSVVGRAADHRADAEMVVALTRSSDGAPRLNGAEGDDCRSSDRDRCVATLRRAFRL